MKRRPEILMCTIPSSLDELHHADAMTEKISRELRLTRDQKNNLGIAVTEAVGNAIVHGNKKDPGKKVNIEFQIRKDEIEVLVQDEGRGFDPNSLDNPLLPENLMKESGRGVFILKTLMDDVHYHFSPKGTTLHMIMKIMPCKKQI
jgi:serine/threonine-protein kinase RsbW